MYRNSNNRKHLKMELKINVSICLVLVKVVCLLAFSLHTVINTWSNLSSDKSYSDTKYVKLSEIPFPVVFHISISPGLDAKELSRLGFESPRNYFAGYKKNTNTYEWSGQDMNVSGLIILLYLVCYLLCFRHLSFCKYSEEFKPDN